jgi:hypothetical protein
MNGIGFISMVDEFDEKAEYGGQQDVKTGFVKQEALF